jgi:hypothetical protein
MTPGAAREMAVNAGLLEIAEALDAGGKKQAPGEPFFCQISQSSSWRLR